MKKRHNASYLSFINILIYVCFGLVSCNSDSDPISDSISEDDIEKALLGEWYFDTDRFHNVLTIGENSGTDIYYFTDGQIRKYLFTYSFTEGFMIVANENDGGFDGIYLPKVQGNSLFLDRFENGVFVEGRKYQKANTDDSNSSDNSTNELSSDIAQIQDYGVSYATIQGKVSLNNYASIIRPDIGIEYSYKSDFTDSKKVSATEIVNNQFIVSINELCPNTKFYYRVYSYNSSSSYKYGATQSFITKPLSSNQLLINTGEATITSTSSTYKSVCIANNHIIINDVNEKDTYNWICGIVHSEKQSMLTEEKMGDAISYDLENYIGGYSEMQYLLKELNSFTSFSGNVTEGSFDGYFKSQKSKTFYYCLYVKVCSYPEARYFLGEVKSYSTNINTPN